MSYFDIFMWILAFLIGTSLFIAIICLGYIIYKTMEASSEAWVDFLDMFGKWWTR